MHRLLRRGGFDSHRYARFTRLAAAIRHTAYRSQDTADAEKQRRRRRL